MNTINTQNIGRFLSLKSLPRSLIGAILIGSLAGYTPAIGSFPPVKQDVVKASETVIEVTATEAPIQFGLPHIGYISTYYTRYHPGIDIAAGLGFPVKAVASGVVTNQGYNFFGLGLVVEITHEYGYKSTYGHLGKTYVKSGQNINAGDSIGQVGMTGHTSGPHTHFELTKDGNYIDPTTVLPKLPNIANAWGDTSENAKSLVSPLATTSAKISNK